MLSYKQPDSVTARDVTCNKFCWRCTKFLDFLKKKTKAAEQKNNWNHLMHMLWCRKHKANAFCILNSATTDHQRQWLPATLTNSRVMQGGSRWPKSLFVRLAGQNWGGEHCWRHSEDKPRHSPGHAWVTRLAPDLHTVHTPASGPTGSCACTCTRTHTHTRTQHTDTHADCRRVERTGTHHWEIYTAYNWGRLQKEEKNHNKSTQGCMRLNRLECLKVDSKTSDFRRG